MNPLMNRATKMAERLHSEGQPLGVIPISIIITIITSLVQAIMQCMVPNPTPTPAAHIKDYVTKHYDATTGKYDEYLVKRMKRQAKLAGKRNNQPLDDAQQNALALESLDEARRGQPEVMAAIDQTVADDPHAD